MARSAHGLWHRLPSPWSPHGPTTPRCPIQTDRNSAGLCRHAPAKRAICRYDPCAPHGRPMTQDARVDRVTTHLIFRFKDGSIYEDTTIFSQRGTFRLLSDHLILRGPSFKQPMDTSINTSTGQIKVRYTEAKGKEKVIAQRMELPPDVA